MLYSLIAAVFCDSFLVTHRQVQAKKKAQAAATKGSQRNTSSDTSSSRQKSLFESIREQEEQELAQQPPVGITRVEVSTSFPQRQSMVMSKRIKRESWVEFAINKSSAPSSSPPVVAVDNNNDQRREGMKRLNTGIMVISFRKTLQSKPADKKNSCWKRLCSNRKMPVWMTQLSAGCGMIVENNIFQKIIALLIWYVWSRPSS